MSVKPPPAPVWVNGIRYNDIKEALEQINLLLGRKIHLRWVSAIVNSGDTRTVDGVTISAMPPESGQEDPGETEPPKPPPKRGRPRTAWPEPDRDEPDPPFPELSGMKLKWLEEAPIQKPITAKSEEVGGHPASSRLPLLRYPRGEMPLERGICHGTY
jgi:hypothetical protein